MKKMSGKSGMGMSSDLHSGLTNKSPKAPSEPSVRELRVEELPPESPEHGMFGEALTQHRRDSTLAARDAAGQADLFH